MYQGNALQEQDCASCEEALKQAERRALLKAFFVEVLCALVSASVVIPLTVWLLLEALQ